MLNKYLKSEWLTVLVSITALWGAIFVVTGIFKGGFNYFLDDHQILLCHGQYTSFHQIFVDPFVSAFTSHSERFRPLYIVFLRLFSEVYGLNPIVWYVSSFFMALATTLAFYFVGRKLSFSTWEAALFSLLIVFGNQASTYARFGTPETTSTLLIALALACAAARVQSKSIQVMLDVFFVGFATLAAFNKEACILMLPALALFKVWIYAQHTTVSFRTALNKHIYSVALLLAVFCFLVGYIYLTGVSGPGYAGISKETFSLATIHNLFKTLIKKTSLMIALGVGAGYLWMLYPQQSWKQIDFIGFGLIAGLIIFPQLILYAKSGIDNHYLLPIVIGIAFLTIYPLVKIKIKYPSFYKIAVVLIVLMVMQHIYTTYRYFQDVARTTSEIRVLVDDVSHWAGPKGQIVVFGNPYVHFERLFGFKTVTDKVTNNQNVFLAAYGSSQSALLTDVFKNEEKSWGFLDPNTAANWYKNKTYKDINYKTLSDTVIVVMSYEKIQTDLDRFISNWFDPSLFLRKDYKDIEVSIFYRK